MGFSRKNKWSMDTSKRKISKIRKLKEKPPHLNLWLKRLAPVCKRAKKERSIMDISEILKFSTEQGASDLHTKHW